MALQSRRVTIVIGLWLAMNRQSQGVAKRQIIGSLQSFDVDQTHERNTRGSDSFCPLTV